MDLLTLLLLKPVERFLPHYIVNDCGIVLNPKVLFQIPYPKKDWKGLPMLQISGAELLSGRWIASYHYQYSNGGSGSGVWVGDGSYTDEAAALNAMQREIYNRYPRGDSWWPKILKFLPSNIK